MAANPSLVGVEAQGLEPWRRYFRGVDVFNVIAHAILVAATDMPQEFRRRRDSIVEQIYVAPAVVPTVGMDAGEGPAVAKHVSAENAGDDDVAMRSCKGGGTPDEPDVEEKEVTAGRLTPGSNKHLVHGHGGDNNIASGACDEMGLDYWLDMLAHEMDEATLETEEVLRIKAILLDHQEQSVDVLFESLRRLQLMQLTVDKLKSTEIGVAVAALGKHKSHRIRKLVQDITKGWKVVADEWIAATKQLALADKSLEKANSSAVEDEGGLAIPPMDVGALFMSQATAIQHVSEFLDGIDDDDDDDGILNNHIISMDKDGGSGSTRKCKGPRPSATVAGTQEPITVQALSATQGSFFKKRNPQNRRCDIENADSVRQHQGLEEREGRPLQRNPVNKMLNAEKTTMHKTQVVLPKRPEVVFLASNIQKHQESGPNCTRVVVKYDKPSSTEGEPRSLSKGTPLKAPHEDVKPRQNRGEVTFTGNPPIAAARKPLFDHVIKTGRSVQSLEAPKVGLGKRNIHLADMGLEKTKRRLREAYEEAENAKRKRTIQVMEPNDIPKPMGRRPPVMKSRHPIRRITTT